MPHTPAPWKITPQTTHNGSFLRIKGETVKICNIVTRDYETAEANAKLIAAAPVLLEALKYLVRYCTDNDTGAELSSAMDAINQAIE